MFYIRCISLSSRVDTGEKLLNVSSRDINRYREDDAVSFVLWHSFLENDCRAQGETFTNPISPIFGTKLSHDFLIVEKILLPTLTILKQNLYNSSKQDLIKIFDTVS